MDYVRVGIKIFLLRGNHESETKSDDGITALSLFPENIITHTKTVGKYTFIGKGTGIGRKGKKITYAEAWKGFK